VATKPRKPPEATRPEPARPTGLKKWLFRLATMTLVPALLFGLLELGLRLVGYGYPTAMFIPDPTGDPAGYVANYHFSRRFFPPALARVPSPVALPAVKPAGAYRIFVLGESAAQGFPDPSMSFARILEVMLRDRYPGTAFEVVNTALTAINSHVILPIARDCAEHQPDLFIAYIGNNEVVGPFGAANVLGPFSPHLSLIRASLAVKATRIGQLLSGAVQWLGSGRDTPRYWGGMEMFLKGQVRAGDARLQTTYAHFRENLADICQAGVRAGAQVVVCTVPVNLRDCAPFASLHAPDLTPEQTDAWEQAYQAGTGLEAAGKFAEAIARYEEAARIDDQFADLQFRLARCHAALGQAAAAGLAYSRARDLDALRFRADTAINATIRHVAGGRAAEGVHLVDAEQAFAAHSPAGTPGEDLFYEHVHLNFAGNYLLARSILQQLQEVLPPSVRGQGKDRPDVLSQQACAERLAYTGWSEYQDVGHIREQFRQPPFINQLDGAEREQRWAKRLHELRPHRQPQQLEAAAALHRKAVQDAPGDWMLRLNYARVLAELGRVGEAIGQCQAAVQQHPYLHTAHHRLGTLLLRAGRTDEARASFQAALRLAPDYAGAHYGLADVLAAEGQVEEAVAAYAGRVESAPDRVDALVQMAGFLSRVGRPRDAQARLTEALQLHPDDPMLHVFLGNALANDRALDAAIREYETALRLRPNWPEMADHLANLRKRRDGAVPANTGK
jgi:tetratricopeptide (TPR) repeat protein